MRIEIHGERECFNSKLEQRKLTNEKKCTHMKEYNNNIILIETIRKLLMKINREREREGEGDQFREWEREEPHISMWKCVEESGTVAADINFGNGCSAAKSFGVKTASAISMDVVSAVDDDDDYDGTMGRTISRRTQCADVCNVCACVFVGHYVEKRIFCWRFKVRLFIQMCVRTTADALTHKWGGTNNLIQRSQFACMHA